jgi:hypothetical protein
MAQLYTDQTHLKMVLRGHSPRMTAISESATTIIDPAFTPGMGALSEDARTGRLRCPVRGCGHYFHRLTTHLNSAHGLVGGADAVRAALSIPKAIPLYSKAALSNLAATSELRPSMKGQHRHVTNSAGAGVRQSLAYRNARSQCDAQLAGYLTDLANELGRTPSLREFETRYGGATRTALLTVYGSWNNALALCGLVIRGKASNKIRSSDILPALRAWYVAHGDLPLSTDAAVPTKGPALPAYATILRAFNASGWRSAMEIAASLLDIYGGRYGLPIENKPGAAA